MVTLWQGRGNSAVATKINSATTVVFNSAAVVTINSAVTVVFHSAAMVVGQWQCSSNGRGNSAAVMVNAAMVIAGEGSTEDTLNYISNQ